VAIGHKQPTKGIATFVCKSGDVLSNFGGEASITQIQSKLACDNGIRLAVVLSLASKTNAPTLSERRASVMRRCFQ